MPTFTRGRRQMFAYATHNGSDSSRVKRKRPEDVAPVLQRRHKMHRGDPPNAGENDAEKHIPQDAVKADSAALSTPLSMEVLDYLRARCPSAPSKVSRGEFRLVQSLSTNGVTPFSVKRMKIGEKNNAIAVCALAALQRRALVAEGASLHGASLLVLVENDKAATALATRMREVFGLQRLLLLDSKAPRFPTFPTVAEESDALLADRTALVVASIPSLLQVEARSAIWKFIGAYAILLGQSTPPDLTEATLLTKLCRERWRCLGHTRVAAVMAPSRNALFSPLADALTTMPPSEQTAAETSAGTHATETATAPTAPTATAAVLREPVKVHYAVVEGAHRFQTLYALLMGLGAGKGLVVHFATREACQFMHTVLYALGKLPAELLLLCDYEGSSSYVTKGETEKDRRQLCAQFNQAVCANGGNGSGYKTPKDRAVLLSAYGLVPRHGTVFVQYDIMVDVVNYTQFVSDVLTPAAYKEAAIDPAISRRSRTPVPADRREVKRQAARSKSPAPPPSRAMYRHVIVFLRKNEVEAALPLLQAPGKRLQVTFEPILKLPSITRHMLTMQKLKSLHRKQFAVQNDAFAAYRATMLLYSLIGPLTVYNEKRVELEKVAEEFGYTLPPILDLRTRDTEYRPKEDIYRAARERAHWEQRKAKLYAAEHIVGEEPEEHIPDTVEE